MLFPPPKSTDLVTGAMSLEASVIVSPLLTAVWPRALGAILLVAVFNSLANWVIVISPSIKSCKSSTKPVSCWIMSK